MKREHDEAELYFDFWHVGLRTLCQPSDIEDLKFFYGSFLSDHSTSLDVSLRIRCRGWPSRGFFTSTLANDGLEKSIEVEDHRSHAFSGRHNFKEWSGVPSPLPPFGTSCLLERLAVYSGAAVRLRDGRIAVIIGPHYIGKTSAVLTLCQGHGAQLISDSLVIIDTRAQTCLTYQAPLGFRRKGLEKILPTLETLDHRLTVSRDTGLVALVRPEAILGRDNALGGPIDHLIILKTASVPQFEITATNRPNLRWFTAVPEEAVEACLPQRAIEITLPPRSSAAGRAAAINAGAESA